MPSSTSNSRVPTRRKVMVLLVACTLVCLGIEASTAILFSSVSRTENRRINELQNAAAIRTSRDRREIYVLVAGNSLLLEGVDFRKLQEDVGPGIELRRAAVENTFYLDWYYGLRKLFRMGSHPDAVVLVLNPTQLISRLTDGDYGAHFLVDSQDLLKLARDTGADRNRLSGLALSNISFFYGARVQIRNWILGNILPTLPSLTHRFHEPATPLNSDSVQSIATARLHQLQMLCEQHGVELIVVIPPSLKDLGENAVMSASAAARVRVLLPIAPGTLIESDYSDAFHLNSTGAKKFTPALADNLRQVLFDKAGTDENLGGSRPARREQIEAAAAESLSGYSDINATHGNQ